jgi:hypothetical protein
VVDTATMVLATLEAGTELTGGPVEAAAPSGVWELWGELEGEF